MAHPMLNDFLRPQDGENGFWWWVLGLLVTLIAWFVGSIILFIIIFLPEIGAIFRGRVTPDIDSLMLGTRGYLFLLLSFLPLYAGFLFAQKGILQRPWRKLLTAFSKFRWGKFVGGLIGGGIAFVIVQGLGSAFVIGESIVPDFSNIDWKTFGLFAVLTLVFVPLQASSEEIMFRGYINQFLARYIPNIWVVFAISSALFASLHYFNVGSGPWLWPYLSVIFLMGFGFCILVFFEAGIESACGLHTVNNVLIFLILGTTFTENSNVANMGDTATITGSLVAFELVYMIIAISLILFINRKLDKTVTDNLPSE